MQARAKSPNSNLLYNFIIFFFYFITSLFKGKTTKNTLTLEEQEEARLQAEREREEEERLLELKNEEYELLDEDSLQVHQKHVPCVPCSFLTSSLLIFCRISK